MTYYGPQFNKERLAVTFCEWSSLGTESVGDLFQIAVLNSTYATTPTVQNGTQLVLSAGHYYAQVYCDITRPSASERNVRFSVNVDGVDVGQYGHSDFYYNQNNDVAEAEFTLTTSGVLGVSLLGIETSLPTVTDNSRVVLWRVPQEVEVRL